MISLTIPDPTQNDFKLRLTHLPTSTDILTWLERHGVTVSPTEFHPANVTVALRPTDAPAVRQLVKVVRGVVRKGQTYPEPNWMWICPRTAASLEGLAGHLRQFQARMPV